MEDAIQKADVLIEALAWIRRIPRQDHRDQAGRQRDGRPRGHAPTCWSTWCSWKPSACARWSCTAAGPPSAVGDGRGRPRAALRPGASRTPTAGTLEVVERGVGQRGQRERLAREIEELGGRGQAVELRHDQRFVRPEPFNSTTRRASRSTSDSWATITRVDRQTVDRICAVTGSCR